MKKYVLAIDQGTTSTRAILFDKNQQIMKIAQKEIQNFFPSPGYVEQDANEIWLSTLSVIAEIFSSGEYLPSEVESIGITNQRETTIVWNKKTGLPVYHAIVWQSRQTNYLVDEYKAKGVEDIIKAKTGLVLDPYFSATKIRFILDKAPNIKNTDDLIFGTIDTWLLWKLTNGKVHATDVTNASRTLLFNIHTLDWDDELLEIFGIPKTMLPEIKESSDLFGYVDPYHFFNESCPICGVAGDQQAALFGQSCFKEGDVKNTYGTGGFLLINTGEKPVISDNGLLSTVAWSINGEVNYALEGSIFVSGSLIQWLRDGLKFFDNASKTEAIANSVDSSNGVIIIPAFTGLGAPYWNKDCQGAIFGLTRGIDYRHIVRAALESMAYQSKDLIHIMEMDTGLEISSIKVDGGASANKFLLQFQSDILEMPVIKGEYTETTALGAARLAGLKTGFYKMSDFNNDSFSYYEPKMEHEEVVEKYDRYKRAVEACISFK